MTRLSNRQYPMLGVFATASKSFRMDIETAQLYDQRPFRSMLIQGWIEFDGHAFMLTDKGKQAWYEFENTDIARKNSDLPLTAYFDPHAYGLEYPAERKQRREREEARGREERGHARRRRRAA